MAFVNEYVSKEDIEKYGLKELCDSYRKNDTLPPPYTAICDPEDGYLDWTIDRDRDIWLMYVATPTDPDFTDYPKASIDKEIFVLYYKGRPIEAMLRRVAISLDPRERPFKAVWKYLGMRPKEGGEIDEEEIKRVLKEALNVYKTGGIYSQLTDVAEIKLINF